MEGQDEARRDQGAGYALTVNTKPTADSCGGVCVFVPWLFVLAASWASAVHLEKRAGEGGRKVRLRVLAIAFKAITLPNA